MVDIKGARCDADGCTKVARFGVRGGQPTACVLHREPHMCKIRKRRPDQSGMNGDASVAGVGDGGGAAAADALREDPPKGMAPLPHQGRGVAVGGLDNAGNHGISNGAVNTGMISCKLEDNSGNVGNHGISYGGFNTGVISCKLEDNTGDGGGNTTNAAAVAMGAAAAVSRSEVGAAAAVAPKEEEYERIPEFQSLQADRLPGTPGGRLDMPSEIPELEPADVWLGDLMRQAMTQESENATAQQQPKHETKPDTSGGMSYPLGAQQQFFLSHLSGVGNVSYFLPKHVDESHQPTARMNPTARATASWPPCHPAHHKQHTPQPSVPPSSNVGWVKDAGSAVIGESPTTALYPSSTTNARCPSMSTASTGVSPFQRPGITSYNALPQGDCRLDAVGGGARTAGAGGVCGDLSSSSNGGPPLVRAGARGPHDHPASGGVLPGDMAAIKTEYCHHSFPPPGTSSLGSSTHWSAF
ncbi:unnamed protein product [Ectocarpus sp. CCAP 1310/34]|nr:unnamed protein product [Ectocarpus sp. CCAP 1310/34]